MRTKSVSRGKLPLATATPEVLDAETETVIHSYYAAWTQRDWGLFDRLLAADFTFSSAAGDDHISKSEFKAQCWESQKDFIARLEPQRVFGRGEEALVMYIGHTMNGRTFRNVEYLRLRGNQLRAIECFFGEQSSFPSAVSSKQG